MMKYKLLMVDDDVQLLKMLSQYFQIKGYEILTAKDGKEALEKAAKGPDLILLDVNMPRMDGLEVCRRIRDKVSCPILFLTARVEEEDRVGGLLSGGDDYIVKPFSLEGTGGQDYGTPETGGTASEPHRVPVQRGLPGGLCCPHGADRGAISGTDPSGI